MEYATALSMSTLLYIVLPLLNPPLISPTAAYSLLNARDTSIQIIYSLQPLLSYLKGVLNDTEPWINTLGALALEDHIMGEPNNMWQYLVLAAQPATSQSPTYII